MLAFAGFDWKRAVAQGRAYFGGDGRGMAGSLALHGLFALLVFLLILRSATEPPLAPHVVPIEIVRLGEATTSPPQPLRARIPQPLTPRLRQPVPAAANRPQGTAPNATKPLPDDLETRLHALARLQQPETSLKPLVTPSATDAPATSNDAAPGSETAYAVRDLIRAQVMRKWNFNVTELGTRGFLIALRIVVLRNGTVAKAEILDRERFTNDALYRDIALSARNAVLLSSPLTLPAGTFGERIDVTLNLNPRDALR